MEVVADENAVILVSGPYPHDPGPRTYVRFGDRGPLVTDELAVELLERLKIDPPLLRLTRPDGSPVWIKGSAIATVRRPLPTEQHDDGKVKSVIIVGGIHQALCEDIPTVAGMIEPTRAGRCRQGSCLSSR